MKDVIQKFEELATKANDILNETFDCRKAEYIYIEILNLVKNHPTYHDQFVTAFLSILGTRKKPWELIQFCMRELQWPEIRNYLLAKQKAELEGRHDWRVISVLNHILEVYETEWDAADMYKYYSKKIEK